MIIIISIMQKTTEKNYNFNENIATDILDVLKLFLTVIIKKLNFQNILMFLTFLTFGIGDGVTGAYMMEVRGAEMEFNPLIRDAFIYHGFTSAILTKCVLALIILLAIYNVHIKSHDNTYWTINGFLIALSIGGLMAINSNINAINGNAYTSPYKVIIIFLGLVVIFVQIGSFIDEAS